MLDFVDDEIVEALQYHLRELGVVFRLGEEVAGVERRTSGGAVTRARRAASEIAADAVLYAAGRQGATDALDLAAAGLEADERGRIAVGRRLPHRAAAHLRGGRRDRLPEPRRDVDGAGPPRRAARVRRAGARGRRAASRIGIYTIPEISFVGRDRGAS